MTVATPPLRGRSGAAEPKPVPHVLDRRFEAVVFDWDGTAVPVRLVQTGDKAKEESWNRLQSSLA